MVSTFIKDIRFRLLDERSDDPSVFTGIGRMVNALLGDDDETTVATSQVPTIPPQKMPSPRRHRRVLSPKEADGGVPAPDISAPQHQEDPSESDNYSCSTTSELNWLDEAIAAAPLAPVSETDYCSDEETKVLEAEDS
jgi:hypothetical protein